MRTTLRRIVEEVDTPWGKAFDALVTLLILASMWVMAVGTMPNLSSDAKSFLYSIETVILALFCAEYALRLWVAEKPLRYATSFFGVIDLLAIAPGILFAGVDTRAVRAIRLLRIFRLFKLARYNAAIRRLHRALMLAWEEVVLFVFASLVLLFIAATGIYHFEHEAQPEAFGSILHSFWWAIITLTTVGYGDVVPITSGGRAFTFLVLLIGLGVVAMPAGLIAASLTRAREMETDEREAA